MELNDFIRILQMRAGFELVNHQEGPNQLRMLGRVQKPALGGWLLVVHHLKRLEEGAAWGIDISKPYFPRNDKLVFAWRIILQGEGVAQYYAAVAQGVGNSPRARATVEEQALPGARANRNAPSVNNRGKGAQSSLKATVGPFALAALQQQQGS